MKVAVIGGGAAGMMAAYAAASRGAEVTLFEKNEKLGKKLYITGKGRCNITNACDIEDFFPNIPTNPKFLYSALYTFSNDALISLLNEYGLETKVERGARVFPVSDKSSDVIRTLHNMVIDSGATVRLKEEVKSLIIKDGRLKGIVTQEGKKLFDRVIICTGGLSYPSTGSTGDGYQFALSAGHAVKQTEPSLVALCVKQANLLKEAQGLTLKNVKLTLQNRGRILYQEQGEMLITHFGVSGPLVLSASAHLKGDLKDSILTIDLKPALTEEVLEKRILRDFSQEQNKQLKNALNKLLPKSMTGIMLEYAGLDANKFVHDITRQERDTLTKSIKNFKLDIQSKRSVKEAIITRGGVDVKQIDPSTMESKVVKGLYFAGEVVDVDGYTGGFNLQIAFSTGYLAGMSAAQATSE